MRDGNGLTGIEGFDDGHEERLWAPWRMRYVGGHREPGCVFCNRLAGHDDPQSLILWRGEHAFAIMNLFPYNTGHIMLAPNDHAAGPEEADPRALAEMALTMPSILRALRRALNCDGFNLGANVGGIAGAGIASHLHEHIVPRWAGDANFMPILASTMVMPELIPVTYAKLRAEIAREPGAPARFPVAVTWAAGERVLADAQGRLPTAEASPDEPLWRAAIRLAQAVAPDRTLDVVWAGSESAIGMTALGISADWLPEDRASWIGPAEFTDPVDQAVANRAVWMAQRVHQGRTPDR
ncbi:MAG: HIT family protein [Chloroflexota bacterium]